MTLMEHLQELRSRLFKASLGVVVGFVVGYWLSAPVTAWLQSPYCRLMANGTTRSHGCVPEILQRTYRQKRPPCGTLCFEKIVN